MVVDLSVPEARLQVSVVVAEAVTLILHGTDLPPRFPFIGHAIASDGTSEPVGALDVVEPVGVDPSDAAAIEPATITATESMAFRSTRDKKPSYRQRMHEKCHTAETIYSSDSTGDNPASSDCDGAIRSDGSFYRDPFGLAILC